MNFVLTPALAYWIHNLDPFIVHFPEWFPSPGIRWYGVAYLLGFIVAAALLYVYHKKNKSPLNTEDQTTLITALILGVLIGGRLGYIILYDFGSFLKNPLHLFAIWKGGMSSHGGFLGVFIATLWFARRRKIHLMRLCDIVASLVPAGLCFGRIGNFISGELWGRITDLPFAVIFPMSAPANIPLRMIPPRHPSQLYEALLEGLFLFIYLQIRFWKKKPLPEGQLSSEFLIGYGLLRIFVECFREPDAALILGISRGQFYSLFIILGGLAFGFYAIKKKKEKS